MEIGQFTFQPSEFLKLAVLMFSAHLLAKRESQMHLPRTPFPGPSSVGSQPGSPGPG